MIGFYNIPIRDFKHFNCFCDSFVLDIVFTKRNTNVGVVRGRRKLGIYYMFNRSFDQRVLEDFIITLRFDIFFVCKAYF
jgi:hypothetical protein